ncbi:MAG: hypothetical protein L3J56_09855 [Bacteroidales bacterium]|nr:hypothetical protein [Bacteroidales bacterium]
MKKIIVRLLVLFLVLGNGACKKIEVPKGTPSCIKKEIRKHEDCISKVVKYEYHGKIVYLFEPIADPSCSYSVFDDDCNYVCSPSGGITGNGDGLCPDFYQDAIEKEIIWSKN